MAKDKLGTKQVCPSCEAKFYDLNKRPAVCPKCGHSFDPEDDDIKSVKAKVQAKAAKEAEKTVADEDDIEEDKAAAPETELDEDEAEEDGTAELSGGPEDIVLDLSSDSEDDEAAAPGAVPAGFTEEGTGVDDEDEDIPLDEDDAFKIDDEGDDGALDLGGDED